MRRRPLLLVLLLVIVGVAATIPAIQSASRGSGESIAEAPAAAAGDAEHTVTLQNKTDERIWVGSSASADGSAPLTGLPTLDPGQSAKITIPENSGAGHWRGTLFPRKGCTGEEGSTFHCAVGDCGPYADRCSTGEQPTSLAEFNFDTRDAAAPWYDVSYVNAVSTPITITPDGVPPPEDGGECAEVGCATDLLAACPPENLTKDQATGKPLVCVNPNRDAKTAYSDALAQKCPKAYSWSKHDAESGNQVMRQCSKCKGMTVTFHGNGTPENPNPTNPNPNPQPSPSDPNPGDPAPAVGKKGINLNPFDGADKALAESGASWYHNWASSTGEVAKPDGVEFVPTIWGPGSVNDAELGKAKQEGKNLLTFNEPDLPSQANMTPEQALDLWPQLEKTGLPLGAPAVATDADKPDGWLDRFMKGAAERGLRVDFIPVHWYGSDFGPAATDQLAGYLQRIHERYKKPIWLTEYGLIDFSQGKPRYPNEQEQTAFIKSSATMLESLDFVQRYAWFTLGTKTSPTGLYDGTNATANGRAYREAG